VPTRPGATITAGDWLRLSAKRFPERSCFIDKTEGVTLTFAEVNARVNRLANSLRSRGLAKGDRVAILATDSFRYMETLLASLKLGTVYVALNYRLTPFELQQLATSSSVRWIFVSSRYLDAARELRTAEGERLNIVCYDGTGSEAIDYEDMLERAEPTEPCVDIDDEDIVGLAYTSGTTGIPKGVLQSQRMIKRMVATMIIGYHVRADDCRYSAAPLFHIAGMSMVFMGIAEGYPNILSAQFDPAALVSWLQADELTAFFVVPTMLSQILDLPTTRTTEYPNLRSIVYGAAPITPALLRRTMDVFGCEFVQAFGAGTEAGMQTTLTPADHKRALAGDEHLLGSIGRAAFGVDLRLCDPMMRDVELGKVGEIVTRSESVMSGYLDMPGQTSEALVDGWFRAGDLARMDADGYLFLAGRSKDMIIRGGENIFPIEIESVIADHPAILEVAVVGTPDEHWGEVVVAFVTIKRGMTSPSLDEIRLHCRSRLAAFKIPTQMVVLGELPRNASGKILKRELQTMRVD
jgi:fatty-acyl-CoA synthase